DLAVELGIMRGEHDAHRAGAEPLEQDVAADPRPEAGIGAGVARRAGAAAERDAARGERADDAVAARDERQQHAAGGAHRHVAFEEPDRVGTQSSAHECHYLIRTEAPRDPLHVSRRDHAIMVIRGKAWKLWSTAHPSRPDHRMSVYDIRPLPG